MIRDISDDMMNACDAIADRMDFLGDLIDGDLTGTEFSDSDKHFADEIRVSVKGLALYIKSWVNESVITRKANKEGVKNHGNH